MVRSFILEGIRFDLGQDAKENDRLVCRASQKDLWFHVKDQASGHGILRVSETDQTPSKAVIEMAAMLVKHFSKAQAHPLSK
jgi:predicted ribosome quality control (RQC) complex YloA/Tae2 family protein